MFQVQGSGLKNLMNLNVLNGSRQKTKDKREKTKDKSEK